MKKWMNLQKGIVAFLAAIGLVCVFYGLSKVQHNVRPVQPPPEGMVLIPAGAFQMGSEDTDAGPDEQPVHSVYVDAFYLDKYEVTNAEYAVFLNEKSKHSEGGLVWYDAGDADAHIDRLGGRYEVSVGYENHPVTEVSWYGAMAYAAWAGKRLPTHPNPTRRIRGGMPMLMQRV